jgi:hypothetical protein
LAAKLMSWITRITVRPCSSHRRRSARMICTAFHVEVVQRLVEQQDSVCWAIVMAEKAILLAAAEFIDVSEAQRLQRQKGDGVVDGLAGLAPSAYPGCREAPNATSSSTVRRK